MKGNIMIRMISLMIIVPILLAHFSGQVDLLKPNWLWLTLFAGLNALQATFTGWCPVSRFLPQDKNTGACCISDTTGTCCSTPEESKSSSACCGDDVSRETKSNDCCSDSKEESCCSGSDTAKESSCCEGDTLEIKVLGTGCTTCNNTIKLIEATSSEMAVKVSVIKVEDVAQIASYGVMSTPGIVINEQVVHSGGMPSKQLIEEWLTKA
ncbi:MTH895/ArsE family thioredoxin-like protein [Thiomicrorhabdus sp. Milos-T2]|uniref:MTH895/ArsE family thioredoxin-like protein n=1 Tax=Thiomicrorhabdus sp. Milos-T2 TaxID=90814 RepID=UPI0009FF28CB|nr:MTH895/ArsE family thioredoxin-like protein [Thiomicrorhabdus sp. Milos-T2]